MPGLPVPIHLQDTNESCGPACVQMVARSFGPPLLTQATLAKMADEIPKSAEWTTSPDQLCDMLNDAPRPASAPKDLYTIFCEDSAAAVIQRAIASIDARLPAVALVDEGSHWVVFRGYTKQGVRLRNPLPPRSNLLPPHDDGDDGCDTVNEADAGEHGKDKDEFLSRAGWQRECLLPCKLTSPPKYLNKFIVVAADLARPLQPVDLAKPRPLVRAGQQPESLAIRGLEASGLSREEGWQQVLRGVSQAGARGTLLVRETGGRSHYLVGLEGAGGNVLAGVDAVSGELLWAKLNPTMKLLESLFSALPSGDPKMTQEVVWTPARETFFSPFYPVLRVRDKVTARLATYVRLYDRLKFAAPHSGPFSQFE